MSSAIGTRPAFSLRGPTTAESRVSIQDLEMALEQALAERNSEYQAVEDELSQLSRIYERLRGDMKAIKEERDRALDAANAERERRARETLELTERLEEAMRGDDASRPVDASALRERFVAERLAAIPTERLKLSEEALPEVPGFKVIGRVGRGGMATVFEARRLKDGASVAIKLLHEGAESGRVRTELFLREAAVMLQLDHPGLVGAFDAGECAYGRYLAMEHIDGDSIATRMRREGPMQEGEAVRIAVQTARALAYCARLGLIHRDVKPSNLLLTPEGAVKLCDFGLAALSSGDGAGRPYGSPGYASPEQLTTPSDVDERADIYGLGCTLWHMVVGRRPFGGPAKEAFEEAKANDLPDPRFEGAEISPRLAQVVRRMGRADRDRRYRRWDECLLDLMLVEKGSPPFSAHLADLRDTAPAGVTGTPEPVTVSPIPDSSQAPSALGTQTITAPAPREVRALQPADDDASVAPEPPAAPPPSHAPRSSWTMSFAALAIVAAALGCAGAALLRPDPVPEMRERARALAASGRAGQAVRCLRGAAEIAPPDAASKLRWEADAIEKK